MRRHKRDVVRTKARQAANQALAGREPTRIQHRITIATEEATPSLTDIARAAHISDSTISSWRRGLRVPTPDAVAVLADVLELRANALLIEARLLHEAAEEMMTPAGRATWLLPISAWRSLPRDLRAGEFRDRLQRHLEGCDGSDAMTQAHALLEALADE